MLKKFISQPLLHFVLIGVGFFILYSLTLNQSEDRYQRTIIVDKPSLLKFMQFRSKSFDQKKFTSKLDNMSEEDLNNLIEDYIEEEVLYREALALGLDKEDYVIKRRLAQKVEFINQELSDKSIDLNDNELRLYFEKNKNSYYIEPNATFTHVYFGNNVHGKEKATVLAEQKLKDLNDKKVPFTKASEYGDRFPYHLNYVVRSTEYVSSHFGPDFADKVFTLSSSDTLWYGPISSKYGSHLVMMTDKEEGHYPDFEQIKNKIATDARYETVRQRSLDAIKDIIEEYDVQVVYESPNTLESDARGESSE